jgi:hypothetical protein
MQVFVSALFAQCRRHDVDAELVLVEWNPPAERPRLQDVLEWPTVAAPGAIRIIEVPEAFHRRLAHGDALPLFQMIAKNVGIRRARGRFVLATNVDVIFPDEIMELIAARSLDSGRLYRLDRHDVPRDVPWPTESSALLDWCAAHVQRVNLREGTFRVVDGGRRVPVAARPPVWKRAWRAGRRALAPAATEAVAPLLHINACGDFTLLAQERWWQLRGYPELEMFSFHLDSVLCHAAHASGAAELALGPPFRIFHIDHAPGSGWSPDAEHDLFERLRARGVPWLEHAQMQQWAEEMHASGRPKVFNGDDWGLGGELLPETALGGRTL